MTSTNGSLRKRFSRWLLKDETARLEAASHAFTDLYQRWPTIFGQMATQDERDSFVRLGELDSRYIDLLARQIRYNTGQVGYEATEADRLRALDLSRRAYDNDVLTEAIIDIWTDFGYGVNLDIVPRDPKARDVWDEFWEHPLNSYLLSQKNVQDLSTWLLRDGDYLLVFYISTIGETPIMRLINSVEIQGGPMNNGVFTLPDERNTPVLYRRQLLATGVEQPNEVQYFRDWRATDDMVAEVKRRTEWDFSDGTFMEAKKPLTVVKALHVAHKRRTMRGWPLMTTGQPWSSAYKDFLQDRAAIARAAAMYFDKIKTKGGQRAVDAIISSLQSSLTQNSNTYETNPNPTAAATWVENEQLDRTRMPMQTGAQDAATDGAALMGQAGLAGRVYPHWLGRGESYRLATATAMELPTLRAFNRYQLFWSSTWQDIADIVLAAAEQYNPSVKGEFESYEVDVNTDALLTVDMKMVTEYMKAIGDATKDEVLSKADAQTLGPYIARIGMQSLGIRNVDDILPMVPGAKSSADATDAKVVVTDDKTTQPGTAMPTTQGMAGSEPTARAGEVQARGVLRGFIGRLHEISKVKPDTAHVDVKKKLVATSNKINVYLVDGDVVRDEYDMDYTQGGHDIVYPYIKDHAETSDGEVWLDNDYVEHEWGFILLHELHERKDMLAGMTYEKAHPRANEVELKCRRDPSLLDGELAKFNVKWVKDASNGN